MESLYTAMLSCFVISCQSGDHAVQRSCVQLHIVGNASDQMLTIMLPSTFKSSLMLLSCQCSFVASSYAIATVSYQAYVHFCMSLLRLTLSVELIKENWFCFLCLWD